MCRFRYLFYQVFLKIKYEKKRYMLYILSFYTGLLLPAFCIANIRSVDQVIYYTTFKGMERAAQIDWLGEKFDAVSLDEGRKGSVSAFYEEDITKWNHQYVTIKGIDEHFLYPLPEITGREFTKSELKDGENVCLLNRKNAEQYTCNIGDMITIRNRKFKIIGFIEDEKHSGIIIPYRAMERAYASERLIQFSYIFLSDDEDEREETSGNLVRQIEINDKNAEILEVTNGEVLYENALAAKTRWRAVRGAAAGVSLFFFLLNEIIVLAGKIKKERQAIGVNMALGASEKEVRLCLLFETLMITFTAAVLILSTLVPLARVFGLESAVILDSETVIIFLVMAFLMCELLTWGAFNAVKKSTISAMLKAGDL